MQASSAKPRVATAMAALMFVYFLSYTFGVMPAIVIPRAVADLNGMSLFAWAMAASALASAIVTILFGKLSDIYGRRTILLVALLLTLAGSIYSALSPNMLHFIISRALTGLGVGALGVLCFTVLGDLFSPLERGKGASMLNVAATVVLLAGPTLAGVITDGLGWRWLFWMYVPLTVIAAILVWIGIPRAAQSGHHTIDTLGMTVMTLAAIVLLLAFSFAGTRWAWGSVQVIGMLVVSLALWALFIRIESKAVEPALSPSILTNRLFMTPAVAGLISTLGVVSIAAYLPLFLQGVREMNTTAAGQTMTPYNVVQAVMGIVGGLLLARFKKYRAIMIFSYAAMVIALFWMSRFTGATRTFIIIAATMVFGLGLGALPTINALVVQSAVPLKMIGQVTGGFYFFIMMGVSVSPAILGSVMNTRYANGLQANLPAAARAVLDASTLASLNDPRALLNPPAMDALRQAFGPSDQAATLFLQTSNAMRSALGGALAQLYLIGGIAMIAALLLIVTIPDKPMAGSAEPPVEDLS